MARGDIYLGNASAVGITPQAAGSTGGWDGTPHVLRYFTPIEGQAGLHIGRSQEPDPPTMAVDAESVTAGGSRCSGHFTIPLSYAYNEGLFGLIAGALAVKTEASAPYFHTSTPARGPLYATLAYYWDNYKGTKWLETITNALITQLTITQDPEKKPLLSGNWYAQKHARTTPGAAPTLVTLEYPEWTDNVLTLGGATLNHYGLKLDIAWAAEEGKYGIGDADNPAPIFVARSAQRVTTLSVKTDDTDEIGDLLISGADIATNSIVWNNGGTTTAEREIGIALSSLRLKDTDLDRAKFGTLPVDLTLLAYGAAPFTIVSKNGLSAAEPPTS